MFAYVQVGDVIVTVLFILAFVGFAFATRKWSDDKLRSLFVKEER